VKISDKGLDLIKSFESLRLEAYMPTPNDVPTIGYGHTKGVQMGDTCTEQDATDWLRDDCAEAENCINKAVRVPITQNEFDALVSLVFNIGCPAFSGSTLLKLLNNHDFDGASLQFTRWNKQDGQAVAGLTRRREAERVLFA
jgi:lysozyme